MAQVHMGVALATELAAGAESVSSYKRISREIGSLDDLDLTMGI
jgi:hypothetical protein